MTLETHDTNESAFAAAWTAFAHEDAKATAPPELELRVIEAVRAEYARRHGGRRIVRRRLLVGLEVAAAVLLVAAIGLRTIPPVVERAMPEVGSSVDVAAGSGTSQLSPELGTHSQEHPIVQPRRPNAEPSVAPVVPAALMTLAADPIQDTELLQLVRVRMPRGALRALGVALTEPDASGLVDVDVLVGDDGLPRDIRQIRPVLAAYGRD